jgi:Bacterial PH domain
MEFEITPPTSSAVTVLSLIAGSLVVMAVMAVWTAWSAVHGAIAITDQGLEIRIPIYGRTIPLSKLDLSHARVLNPDETSDIRGTRTNGIGIPGYAAGWFKLASGAKALVCITNGPVLYIPTQEGYSLLLSVKHPDVVLGKLRSGGAA